MLDQLNDSLTGSASFRKAFSLDRGDLDWDNYIAAKQIFTELGKEMLEKNLSLLKSGKVIRTKQNQDEFIENWPKRNPSDGEINWTSTAYEIDKLIRATTFPYPGAYTFFKNKKIIIWKSTFNQFENFESGKIISVVDGIPTIGTQKGTISFKKISVENGSNESEKNIFSSSDIGMYVGQNEI